MFDLTNKKIFVSGHKEIVGSERNIVFDEKKTDGTYLKRLDTSKINEIGWYAKYST